MPLSPLPYPFSSEPFTTRAALAAGISSERLRRLDLEKPFWGIRVPPGTDRASSAPPLEQLCRAYATRMPPDAAFSHLTAAQLFGMPVPARFVQDARLHVATPIPRRSLRGRGVRGHKLDLVASEVVLLGDLPLTSPTRTWIDLSRGVTTEELIVLGDYLLSWRHPLASLDQLIEVVRRAGGRRGVSTASEALPYLSDRSDSPPESQFRYRFAQAGLPHAAPNVKLFTDSGDFLAMPDLVFEQYKEVFDYEGDHHRTEDRQWQKDIARVRTLEENGWHSTRGSKADLRDSAEVIAQLKRRFAAQGWNG
jgi:hypothetical protein